MQNKLPLHRDIIQVLDKADLRAEIGKFRSEGLRVGFVPTMGALHAGHIALVSYAKRLCDVVIVSIFVNPKQFAPHEDLERYPRQEAKDIAFLAEAGCDLVYLPKVDSVYPQDFVSQIKISGPALGLESDFRPQFFDGVATVVCKLFNQVTPDIAVFGEKDYQQLKVVQTLVRDLDMPIDVLGMPTLREADGLAMSSRNAYLNGEERLKANQLHNELKGIAEKIGKGENAQTAIDKAIFNLKKIGFGPIDYISLRQASDLSLPLDNQDKPLRLLAAAWLGKTRLIDNIAL
jgi:pantoate--beta-alanine ligase